MRVRGENYGYMSSLRCILFESMIIRLVDLGFARRQHCDWQKGKSCIMCTGKGVYCISYSEISQRRLILSWGSACLFQTASSIGFGKGDYRFGPI